MRAQWVIGLTAALALGGCSTVSQPGMGGPALTAAPEACHAESVESVPGRAWWAWQRWRYSSDAAATAAYTALLQGQSPWPDWFAPVESDLPAGTRLQMALGLGQTVDQPGGFATFDNITSVAQVRDDLAVLKAWKPDVDRVVIYETVQPMRVRIGPIGPQIDPGECRLLMGRWSQVQMLVPSADRMTYLRVIEVRPLP